MSTTIIHDYDKRCKHKLLYLINLFLVETWFDKNIIRFKEYLLIYYGKLYIHRRRFNICLWV